MISPEILRRYPHFAGVPEPCLRAIAELSEEKSFNAGERIFEASGVLGEGGDIEYAGEEAASVMLLTEGGADIAYRLAPEGGEVVVGTAVPGDLMAMCALIPPFRLAASVIAKRDGRLIAIKANGLRRLMEEEPALGYNLMAHVAKALMNRLGDARLQLSGQI